MNTKVMFSSVSDEWSTPKDVYESLNNEFHFNDDPCPLGGVGGLDREWGMRTFVNPPYSEISKWVKYAFEQSKLGKKIVMLIPSRTDTRWWHDYCMKGEIRFIKGRLKFGNAKYNAPFPSAVVIFGVLILLMSSNAFACDSVRSCIEKAERANVYQWANVYAGLAQAKAIDNVALALQEIAVQLKEKGE